MHAHKITTLVFVALLGGAAPGLAQQVAATASVTQPAEPKLVFDREVFAYQGAGRRDPFNALAAENARGTRFEELKLKGIIFSETPGQSLALIMADKKIHRARNGDLVGNARVLEISARRVVFAVEEFGVVRQEMLELKRYEQGAQ